MRYAVAALVLVLAMTTVAHAEGAPANLWSVSFYGEQTMLFEKGGVTHLPTTFVVGPGLTRALSLRWSLYVELSVATPVTEFAPAPRVVIAPTLEVKKDRFYVAFSALYQLNPPYNEASTSHMVGVGILPILMFTPNIATGMVISPSVTFGAGHPVWALTFAPVLQLTL